MNPVHENFKASIENLQLLLSTYIQPNKTNLETRSVIHFSTPTVSPSSTTTTTIPASIAINDHIRMCRIYCIMLWTYWDAFNIAKVSNIALEELQLIRHCLVHHEGDMARYSQHPKYGSGGTKLITLTNGRSFVQGYNLLMSESDLVSFTGLVKSEFKNQTGITF